MFTKVCTPTYYYRPGGRVNRRPHVRSYAAGVRVGIVAFRVADPLHLGVWSRQGHSGSSWNRTGSRDRPAGRSSNGSRDKPGGSPGIDSRIGPEIDLGACRGTERCPPWLSDIPPGVSAKRYGQFLIILSEKNATSEYIDWGQG